MRNKESKGMRCMKRRKGTLLVRGSTELKIIKLNSVINFIELINKNLSIK